MSLEEAYPSAPSVAQELGLYESDVVEAASIHFIFNHFSKKKSIGTALKRMQHAFEESITHVNMRISLLNAYETAFFDKSKQYDRDAVTIAVLCSPFLKETTTVRDLDIDGLPARITDDTVKRAFMIQQDAMAIKETSDLDYQGLRANNDAFMKEAYFLSYINLIERMNRVNYSGFTYDSLSDHLRYDLICADRYISENNLFGRILTKAIDEMEDKVLEELIPEARIRIVMTHGDAPGPKLV